ncbi:Rz1-like lysis system protein LysC [Volucribacter psittacicida]|uniref:Rz1-like lysis system protein LysC n=1 Tax=Volucribacter psittacicida TaxID=203482 RepID=UPI001050CCC1|nr:Rz1-like lysis system protein LysC [Volucribacter psittacicida]
MLFACSTRQVTPIKTPIICPITSDCKTLSNFRIKQNKDLVQALHNSLTTLSHCVIAYQVLNDCIENHNNMNLINNKP